MFEDVHILFFCTLCADTMCTRMYSKFATYLRCCTTIQVGLGGGIEL
jgi:hypothetical protein